VSIAVTGSMSFNQPAKRYRMSDNRLFALAHLV